MNVAKLSGTSAWLILVAVVALTACGQAPDDANHKATDEAIVDLTPDAAAQASRQTGHNVDGATGKPAPASSALAMTVYKSPTCGCCSSWISYLEEEGFTIQAINHDNVESIKPQLGLPDMSLASCHTGLIDGYVIEGHVPANDILRLLQERPADVKGLTAPGMPMMSPGMASRIPKDYDVLTFTETGETAIYSSY